MPSPSSCRTKPMCMSHQERASLSSNRIQPVSWPSKNEHDLVVELTGAASNGAFPDPRSDCACITSTPKLEDVLHFHAMMQLQCPGWNLHEISLHSLILPCAPPGASIERCPLEVGTKLWWWVSAHPKDPSELLRQILAPIWNLLA